MDVLLYRAGVRAKSKQDQNIGGPVLLAKQDLNLILREQFWLSDNDIAFTSPLVLMRIAPPVVNENMGLIAYIKDVRYRKGKDKNVIYLTESDKSYVTTDNNPREVIFPDRIPIFSIDDFLEGDFDERYYIYPPERVKYKGVVSHNTPAIFGVISTPFITQPAVFSSKYAQNPAIVPEWVSDFNNPIGFVPIKLDWILKIDYTKLKKIKELRNFYPLQVVVKKKTISALLDSPSGGRVIMELLWHNDSDQLVKILDDYRVHETRLRMEETAMQKEIRRITILRLIEILLSTKRVDEIHNKMDTENKTILHLLTAAEIDSLREYVEDAKHKYQTMMGETCVPFLSWRRKMLNEAEKRTQIVKMWGKYSEDFEFDETTHQYVYMPKSISCYKVDALCQHEMELYVDNIDVNEIADRFGDYSKAETFADIYCRYCHREIVEVMDDNMQFTGENGKLYAERQGVKNQKIKNTNFVFSFIYHLLPLFEPVLGLSATSFFDLITPRLGEKHMEITESQIDLDERETEESYWSIVISSALLVKLMLEKKTKPIGHKNAKNIKEAISYIIATLEDYLVVNEDNEKTFRKDVSDETPNANTYELSLKIAALSSPVKSLFSKLRDIGFGKDKYKKPKSITDKTLAAWTNYKIHELVTGHSSPSVPPPKAATEAFSKISLTFRGPSVHLTHNPLPPIKTTEPFRKTIFVTTGTFKGKLAETPMEIINTISKLDGGDVDYTIQELANTSITKFLAEVKWVTKPVLSKSKPPIIPPPTPPKLETMKRSSVDPKLILQISINLAIKSDKVKRGKFMSPTLDGLKRKVLKPLRENKIIDNTSDSAHIEAVIDSFGINLSGTITRQGVMFIEDTARQIAIDANGEDAVRQIEELTWALSSMKTTSAGLNLKKWYIIYWLHIAIAATGAPIKTLKQILTNFFNIVRQQSELISEYRASNWSHIREIAELELMKRNADYKQKVANDQYEVARLEEVDAYTANPDKDIDNLEIEDDLSGNDGEIRDIFN